MPGWVRFTPTIPTKLGQISTDVDKKIAPSGTDGQVQRVARRFALVAMAGELATSMGLTGWQKGTAAAAVHDCFNAWLDDYGGGGNREQRAILSHVRGFFEAHGQSRFAVLVKDLPEDRVISNRAGFIEQLPDGSRQFLMMSEAFKSELCSGFDQRTVTQVLVAAGWLLPSEEDRRTAQRRTIQGMGRTRFYVFSPKMWDGG